jgi:hypothetical protein
MQLGMDKRGDVDGVVVEWCCGQMGKLAGLEGGAEQLE